MAWKLHSRATSGQRLNPSMEWISVSAQGINFSRKAKERWFPEAKYVEFLIDRDATPARAAMRALTEATVHSFTLGTQGTKGNENWCIRCRSFVTAWLGEMDRRNYYTLRESGGLLELVEVSSYP
jgi:hypothetical protein